jgi:hypothetical protein
MIDLSKLEIVCELGATHKNLNNKKYAKVISDYENNWGNCEPIKGNLEVGKEYEIEYIEEHTWHTKIYLKGFKNPFNSVHFELTEGGKEG